MPGTQSNSGHAYLLSGADGQLLCALAPINRRSSGGFGYTVAGVPDGAGDGAGDLLIAAALIPGTVANLPTVGDRRHYPIDGASGGLVQSFSSPLVGEGFGWAIAALKTSDGRLAGIAAGVVGERSRSGRVFVFPLRKLALARVEDGLQVTLLSTEPWRPRIAVLVRSEGMDPRGEAQGRRPARDVP